MVAVEFHHVLELIVEGQFDVISHSHCCYLSLLTLQQVFERRGLTLVDAGAPPGSRRLGQGLRSADLGAPGGRARGSSGCCRPSVPQVSTG
jgi:hypothetical protein